MALLVSVTALADYKAYSVCQLKLYQKCHWQI